MPQIRNPVWVKTYSGDPDAPFLTVEVTFGDNLPTKTVTVSRNQLDKILSVDGVVETIADASCLRTTRFYIDYHVYPDNVVQGIIADEPFPSDWWQLSE